MELDTQHVRIDTLKPYKGNPRRGKIELIRESLRKNGQYRPLVVRKRTREVLAGNQTMLAAKAEGWEKVWVTFVDVDAATAKRIVLIDNRANDLADYDDQDLVGLLGSLPDLEATGYTQKDLEKLQAEFDEGDQPIVEDLPQRFGVVVELDTEQQQGKVIETLVAMGFEPRALYQ